MSPQVGVSIKLLLNQPFYAILDLKKQKNKKHLEKLKEGKIKTKNKLHINTLDRNEILARIDIFLFYFEDKLIELWNLRNFPFAFIKQWLNAVFAKVVSYKT